ncbi:hypothetical protein BDQ17DRAFT_497107 [Cyathus striatus]|nr:hypothetical protein BDQ17DRAFT_497107 [Cyathus striatus]
MHPYAPPHLPPEILDEIVTNLSADRRALCAVSLASSVFLPCARHHLFSEVILESSAICVFLKLLDVPWSTIAPTVRSVIISETAPNAYKGCLETRRKKGYYVPENPQRLRERMQGVHSITFSDISLADIPPPFWRLLNDLKGVKKLVVHQMSFDTPGTFFQYICSLPALETLSISKSSWEATSGVTVLPPAPSASSVGKQFKAQGPFRIPLLDIGRHSQYDIMEWFLMQRPVPPVHTFRIHLDGCCATTAMVRQYIEEAGESVQQLHIDMPTSAMGIQRLSTIDFSPCTGLKGIHIEGLRISSQQTQAHTLSAFMHTLFTSLRTPELVEVTTT